ncbi:hypothetical protein B0H14DRAFT_3784003, partial [Mycena olivaceomarginata]
MSQSQRLRHRRIGTGTCDSSPASSTHLHGYTTPSMPARSPAPNSGYSGFSSLPFATPLQFPAQNPQYYSHPTPVLEASPFAPPPSSTAGHGLTPIHLCPCSLPHLLTIPHLAIPSLEILRHRRRSFTFHHRCRKTKLDKAKNIRLRVHSHIATQIGMTPDELLNPAQLGWGTNSLNVPKSLHIAYIVRCGSKSTGYVCIHREIKLG